MANEFGKDDHVIAVGPEVDGACPALKLGEGGEVTPCTLIRHSEEGGGIIELEQCQAASSVGALVYHRRTSTTHSGPARVNSVAFCAGWERIFGKKNKSSSLN